jgi:hypothetical protein
MVEFLKANWGNIASALGLVASSLAFVFSKSASKAAKQARSSVLQQSLGQEMNSANRIAREITTYASTDRGEIALLRIGELLDMTHYLVARWSSRLEENSRNNLLLPREQLQSAHDVLSRGELANLAQKDRRILQAACQRISGIFSQEYGTAVKADEVK